MLDRVTPQFTILPITIKALSCAHPVQRGKVLTHKKKNTSISPALLLTAKIFKRDFPMLASCDHHLKRM